MRIIEKLINVFSVTQQNKIAEPSKNIEALKREFLEIDSHLLSTVLSFSERKEANAKIHSLAIEIASIFGGPESTQVLAKVLSDIPKDEIREPSEALKEALKNAELSILIKEFRAIHLMMLCALRKDVQVSLNIRLNHVATEIANRLGGPEFFWMLSTVLQKNKAA